MDSFKLSFSGSPQVTVLVFSSRTKWSNPSKLRNMLAMHRWILLLLAGLLATGRAEDLLELSCSSDAQCAQFERGRCVDMACICTARGSGERVPCTPLEERLKLTNIIGGACPCPMPNAICHTRWQQCHCSEGHVSSDDRRRCLPAVVPVGGSCEFQQQCQRADRFSSCIGNQCLCLNQFEFHEGRCLSVLREYTGRNSIIYMKFHLCIYLRIKLSRGQGLRQLWSLDLPDKDEAVRLLQKLCAQPQHDQVHQGLRLR